MPVHKFNESDLIPLEQNPLQGSYHMLVIGTFNPARNDNPAQWFYGRPENEFWYLFPRMMGFQSLHPADTDETLTRAYDSWTQFCIEKRIIIIDIFKEVFVELPNYADKHLHDLQPSQYSPFLFQQAFANVTFERVLFTWKGQQRNALTMLKQQYINFFEPRGSRIMHMVTPSLAYAESRYLKLHSWREQYNSIAQ